MKNHNGSFKKPDEEERKKLLYEAGHADAESGFPPKQSDPDYLKGYKAGRRSDGTTLWDEPFET